MTVKAHDMIPVIAKSTVGYIWMNMNEYERIYMNMNEYEWIWMNMNEYE